VKVALGMVIMIGAGVGLMLPSSRGGGASGEAPPEIAAASASQAGPAPAQPHPEPEETRLTRAPSGHFHTEALVNGEPVDFIVDTGATTIALTMADARRIGIAFDRANFQVVGTGASGPVRGQEVMIDHVSVDGKEVQSLRSVVLEGLETSLLGQTYLSQIGSVEMSGDEMILR